MAKPAASVTQFLFTADSGSSTITANRIHGDGSLSPLPGSPLPMSEAPRKVAAFGNSLVVAGTTSLTAYSVDKNSGALQPTDSLPIDAATDFVVDAQAAVLYATPREHIFVYRLAAGKFQQMSVTANPISPAAFAQAANMPALDATGHFVYFVDPARPEIRAFRFDAGKVTPLAPPLYPAGQRPLSVAVVVP